MSAQVIWLPASGWGAGDVAVDRVAVLIDGLLPVPLPYSLEPRGVRSAASASGVEARPVGRVREHGGLVARERIESSADRGRRCHPFRQRNVRPVVAGLAR